MVTVRDDRGFTLIELLVTITIGMIVLAATLDFMTFSFGKTNQVLDRHDAAGRAGAAHGAAAGGAGAVRAGLVKARSAEVKNHGFHG